MIPTTNCATDDAVAVVEHAEERCRGEGASDSDHVLAMRRDYVVGVSKVIGRSKVLLQGVRGFSSHKAGLSVRAISTGERCRPCWLGASRVRFPRRVLPV
jgi:hypothetical protein